MAFQRKKPPAIGVKAPYPGFIEPALATSIDKVPKGERWIHEIKFDGSGCSFISQMKRSGLHPPRQRLDQTVQKSRGRGLAH
jgi:hypothetical protein